MGVGMFRAGGCFPNGSPPFPNEGYPSLIVPIAGNAWRMKKEVGFLLRKHDLALDSCGKLRSECRAPVRPRKSNRFLFAFACRCHNMASLV